VIYQRQPDGRVLVDREMLTTSLERSDASVRGVLRRHCEVAGYVVDATVRDPRHARRAVYDLDAVTAAMRRADELLGIVAAT
jgi:hypothetical protein